MTILELLTKKIDKLKENSQDEIDRIKVQKELYKNEYRNKY